MNSKITKEWLFQVSKETKKNLFLFQVKKQTMVLC